MEMNIFRELCMPNKQYDKFTQTTHAAARVKTNPKIRRKTS